MKACLAVLAGVLVILLAAPPPAQETFEDYTRRMNQEYAAFTEQVTAEYDAFVRAENEAFAAFQAEVEQKWETFAGPTKKDWVEYSADKETRTVVDFEKGEAKVEVLVERVALAADADLARQRLAEAVRRLVADRGKTLDYPVQEIQPQPLGEQPVLADQLRDSSGEPVTQQNARVFAEQVVQAADVQPEPVASRDGVERVKVAILVELVPDHLRIRAEKYLETVLFFARKYDLDSRIVFAMMHTESYFNPKAKSPAPAYGLMQLVPSSGGRDAYRYVHDEDKVVSPNYLYDPGHNIELGCAYLSLLLNREFKKARDETSQLYCAICAYNTGAGNVSRAFTGSKKIQPLIERLNTMTSAEVLQKLAENLPYEETRQYIRKVLERVKFYQEWKT